MSDPTYTTVLCGTDGSESSYRAVDRAAAVARDAGATLLLACVFRPLSAREQQDAADALGNESYKVSGSHPAEEVLQDACDRAKKVGATQVDTVALDPRDLSIVSRADFETFPLIAKLIRWGIDAHMGILFGWPNQLLMAGLGLALVVTTLLGYRIWWRQRPGAGHRCGRRPLPPGLTSACARWSRR